MFDAYRRQAIDAAVEIAHPDIEVRPSIVGGPERDVYRGRDGVRRFFADVEAAWADFRIEVDEFRDLGGATVLILGRSFARGEGSGIPVEAATDGLPSYATARFTDSRASPAGEAALEAVGLRA